jgi:hypothetical protein
MGLRYSPTKVINPAKLAKNLQSFFFFAITALKPKEMCLKDWLKDKLMVPTVIGE